MRGKASSVVASEGQKPRHPDRQGDRGDRRAGDADPDRDQEVVEAIRVISGTIEEVSTIATVIASAVEQQTASDVGDRP